MLLYVKLVVALIKTAHQLADRSCPVKTDKEIRVDTAGDNVSLYICDYLPERAQHLVACLKSEIVVYIGKAVDVGVYKSVNIGLVPVFEQLIRL